MPPPIVFDAMRLFLNAAAPTPRGIDRVDLEYARFFFQHWRGDCVAAIATPWGARWFDRQIALRALNRVEELWSEGISSGEDERLNGIKAWLRGAAPPRQSAPRKLMLRPAAGVLSLLSETGFSFGASSVRAAPRDSVYLNIGQLCWAMPWLVSWLRRRADVKPVFMVHDVIPLERPELVWGGAPTIHAMMMKALARHAVGIIVPTPAARESILAELRRRGRTEIAVATLPHAVADVFLAGDPPDPELDAADYFVVCGAIEPRKNHRLLFAVWEELLRQQGEQAPKLVVIGSPGKGAKPVLDALARCDPGGKTVIPVSGLSSPALRRLMVHAKGLLMPSLAEGFGLPLIEALAVGTPVIASDLPAHREAAGEFAIYLDPGDARAWRETICGLAAGLGAAAEIRRKVATFRPLTTRAYFETVVGFLERFAHT